MPVWGDEAYIAINLMNRGYQDLLSPLDYMQVSPIGFLLAELSVAKIAWFSEYALRLLPLLAGLGALFLYWRWCRLLVSVSALPLALSFFVIGYYPVRHGTEIKPYAFDQLASVALLYLTTTVLIGRGRRSTWWLLAAATALAITCSYPAVFIAGACLAALFWTLPLSRPSRSWSPWIILSLVTFFAFAETYALVGNGQYAKTGEPMRKYWQEAFPPREIWPAIKWLVTTHTGNLFAYPMGGKNGGSTGTFLLFLIGMVVLWRARQSMRWLLITPFALTFIAAVMHRYPYGGSARVAQHLAPIICLGASVGLDSLISRYLSQEALRRRAVSAVLAIFTLIAAVGIIRDIKAPYKAVTDLEARSLVEEIERQAMSSSLPIVVAQPMRDVPVNQQYYLRLYPASVFWNGIQDTLWRARASKGIIWLNFDPRLQGTRPPLPAGGSWRLSRETIATIRLDPVMIPFWQISYWKSQ